MGADWTVESGDWYLNCSLKIHHVLGGISGTFRVACVWGQQWNTWSKEGHSSELVDGVELKSGVLEEQV